MRAASSRPEVLDGHEAPDRPRVLDAPAQVRQGGRAATHAASREWLRLFATSLRLLDAGVVLAAMGAALILRFGGGDAALTGAPVVPLRSYVVVSLLLAVGWVGALVLWRAYDGHVLGNGVEEYKRVVKASLRYWGLVAIACYVGQVDLARGYVAVAFPLGLALLLFGRWSSRRWLHGIRQRSSAWSHRVLVVGDADPVAHLIGQLRREPYAGLHVVGACVPGGHVSGAEAGGGVPVVGGLTNVCQAVDRIGADTVAVASSRALGAPVLRRLGWELEGSDIDLVVAPSLTDVAGPRVHVRPVAGLPLLHVEQPEFTGVRRVVKHTFDRVAAGLGLLAIAPLLAAIAVAIRLDSKGPVLFRQVRVGRDGRPFTIYKFRSMVVDAEERLAALASLNEGDGLLFKMREDPRVTRVGRVLRTFSLDELPQLLNVVTGRMSLVGPRPPLPSEVEQYDSAVRRRLLVKPGITGLWQVSGRSDLPWEEAARLDLFYVENWSFTSDLVILWKTVRAVLRGSGAY